MGIHRVRLILPDAALLLCPAILSAQSVFGTNLIVNGDAEAGPGVGNATPVPNIPGWTNNGASVLTYASAYGLTLDNIVPFNVGKNYFANGTTSSSMTQTINLAAGAATIDAGAATFAASGYFGAYADDDDNAALTVAFLDASGKQLSASTIGGVKSVDRLGGGLYLRRQIGPVPAGARSAKATVNFVKVSSGVNNGYAENLSLLLNAPAAPQTLIGTNIVTNGDAEAGLPIPSSLAIAPDLPNWVRTANFTTDTYGASGADLDLTSIAPPDRGKLYFTGGPDNMAASAHQDIDISSAASLVDTGSVNFALSAWLGGYAEQNDNATVTVQFMNWGGGVLSTVKLGPVLAGERANVSGTVKKGANGAVPAGTRVVRVQMDMTRTDGVYNDGIVDSLSIVLSGGGGPVISANGVATAAAFGGSKTIAPGTWIEIYGQNLASSSREWAGPDFAGTTAPLSLDGVKVTVGGQPAYVRYISPGQVNVQVPSSVGSGQQQLVVTTAAGSSAPYPIAVSTAQPGVLAPSSFVVGGKQYAAALFADGATFVLPPSVLPGVTSRQAKPGETIIVYGVGFGPTSPNIPAGQVVSQGNTLALPVQVTFGGTAGTLNYSGLAPSFVGLYQFNIVVPNVANNDAVVLGISVGGTPIAQTLYTAVHQ
jgi:uncharacterized protein (TIGR03437 family)